MAAGLDLLMAYSQVVKRVTVPRNRAEMLHLFATSSHTDTAMVRERKSFEHAAT